MLTCLTRSYILTRWYIRVCHRYRCSISQLWAQPLGTIHNVSLLSISFLSKLITHLHISYRYAVDLDGTFSSRKTFAYVSPGFPDGIHCDTWGNVYSGTADGIQVWNPAGTLIGKIFLGTTSANFRFAGKGRMVIAAETKLYYVELAAEGVDPKDQF